MTAWDDFCIWEEKNRSQIESVKEILRRELSNEPQALIDDLITIESWNARIGELLAQAESFCEAARSLYLPPPDFGTELARRIELNKMMVPIEQVRAILEALSDAIRQRLICCESILSYAKVYAEPRITQRPF